MKKSNHYDSGSRELRRKGGRPQKALDLLERAHARSIKMRSGTIDDPLLRIEEYSYGGPLGPTANADIDLTVYQLVLPDIS